MEFKELVNELEISMRKQQFDLIAERLICVDLEVLDELDYVAFSQNRGALLFHLLNKLHE